MSIDLSTFAASDFDAVAWIDSLSASRQEEGSIESFFAETEVRVQLMAEDVALSLERSSSEAVQKVPGSVAELEGVKEVLKGLREELSTLLQGAGAALSDGNGGKAAIAELQEVDRVKTRMEEAKDTLQEAAGLAELMASADEVFKEGDLCKSAEVLAQMRRGLEVVGDVPEFAHGKAQLAELKARLTAEASPALAEAIKEQNGLEAARLHSVMANAGRPEALVTIYTDEAVGPLLDQWKAAFSNDGDDPPSVERAIESFYDGVLISLEKESRWLGTALAEHRIALQVAVVEKLHAALGADFKGKINAAMEEGGGLDGLLAVYSLTNAFAGSAVISIGCVGKETNAALLAAIYGPFETYLAKYPDLERSHLVELINGLRLADGGISNLSERMVSCLGDIVDQVEIATARCLRFTGGAAMDTFPGVIDEVLVLFLNQLHVPLKEIAAQFTKKSQVGDVQKDTQVEIDEEVAQGAVALIGVASTVAERIGLLDASIRISIIEATSKLTTEKDGQSSTLQAAVLAAQQRLSASPNLMSRLRQLHTSAGAPQYIALSKSLPRANVFTDAVEKLVEGVLLEPVRSCIVGLGSKKMWRETGKKTSFSLPTFSAYPQEAVTAMGEYLLTVPTLLEPAQDDDNPDDDSVASPFADQWITRIGIAATELYWSELQRISSLSSRGARQAQADLEYYVNILLALSIQPSSQILTYQSTLTALLGDSSPDNDGEQELNVGDFAKDAKVEELVKRQVNLSRTE